MSPCKERHWLEEEKDSAVFLERDLGFGGCTGRLFHPSIRIAILPA